MALFALVGDGVVRALSEAEGAWPRDLFDVRDVSDVEGIAPGWLAKGEAGYEAPPAPEGPPVALITYKADIYRRCTDAEAEEIEMALAAAPVRQRRLFEEAQHLDHADEAFSTMHEAMVEIFGAKRADELLAPA
ncbi:hypothetical protein [Methylobacterium thuringiense]|uniref:Uncharacterized protein n=1 Tax=Methylobacterium thuringiense TaxID=1003091 RepID=A0ABQ4TLL1_9HYPH|nr:hypothetical protein [Methylobacterium thuringiense]GJE54590.1 hypothetical protein EKPJFOCH_1068 [Methylobacterium thuringiense]